MAVGGNPNIKKNAMGQPIIDENPFNIEQKVGPSLVPKDEMGQPILVKKEKEVNKFNSDIMENPFN